MRRDCTTPIFSEPLNENNDKHVEKLQTICKLCSTCPESILTYGFPPPKRSRRHWVMARETRPSSVLAPTSLILTISDVNKQYMSKHCSVIIYLFVLVGGGVNFTNATILIRMHGEIKQASPLKQHWVQALPQSSTYAITMFSKQTARHSEFTKNQYKSSKSLRKRDRNLIHSSREVLKWNTSKQDHLKVKSKKRRENRLPWNPITTGLAVQLTQEC